MRRSAIEVRLRGHEQRVDAASSPSAATRSPGGTRRKIAAIGSSRKASAIPVARRSVARKTRVYDCAFGSARNPAFASTVCPLGGQQRPDPRLRRRLPRRARHDRDLVSHARLRPGGDADDRHLVGDRASVGHVDEASVRLTEGDLARDRLHVRLLADHLREHGREAHLAEHRARVPADGHGRRGDDELHRLSSQVVDGADPGRVRLRHDQRESVRGERDRPLDDDRT